MSALYCYFNLSIVMPVRGIFEHYIWFTHLTNYCVNDWIDTNIYAVEIKIGSTDYSHLSPSIN